MHNNRDIVVRSILFFPPEKIPNGMCSIDYFETQLQIQWNSGIQMWTIYREQSESHEIK